MKFDKVWENKLTSVEDNQSKTDLYRDDCHCIPTSLCPSCFLLLYIKHL